MGQHHHDADSGVSRKEKEKVTNRLSSWISSSISKAKQLPKYRSRRASKSFDHGKVMRDLLSGLTTRDIIQLNDEYHSTAILKELSFQAEAARPSASSIPNDLADLYDSRFVADTFLIFRGMHFPVHKAIICVRSPFFRELLGKINVFASRVPVHIADPNVRPEMLNDVIRFLYCGQLVCSQNPVIDGLSSKSPNSTYESLLIRLSEQFAGPHDLDRDLKHLLETGLYSDASLVFSGQSTPSSSGTKSCRACTDQSEYSCHSSVLASRSVFFKNVVQRHQRRFEEESVTVNTANQKIRIVLDESIIPRRFARIILHSMYRDSNDLISLLPLCVCKCYTIPPGEQHGGHPISSTSSCSGSAVSQPGSSVGQSMHSLSSTSTLLAAGAASGIGQQQCVMQPSHGMSTSASSSLASFASIGPYAGGNSTVNAAGSTAYSPVPTSGGAANYVKEIMDLYEIARFLELDSLIQSCEDMMIESLTIETLVPILKWSEQPHGSPWVKRQAVTFLREEFSSIAASPVLMNLEQSHLLDVVKSDFLQSSELEVLQAVMKWGENRLIKRMEERGEWWCDAMTFLLSSRALSPCSRVPYLVFPIRCVPLILSLPSGDEVPAVSSEREKVKNARKKNGERVTESGLIPMSGRKNEVVSPVSSFFLSFCSPLLLASSFLSFPPSRILFPSIIMQPKECESSDRENAASFVTDCIGRLHSLLPPSND